MGLLFISVSSILMLCSRIYPHLLSIFPYFSKRKPFEFHSASYFGFRSGILQFLKTKLTNMIAFRVLVVDDDPDDRDILRDALEEAGIEPILALDSAQQVFSYLQTVEKDTDLPKLIITDLNMCGITGLELLNALKGMSRYQHIAVVVFSTASHSPVKAKCLAAGAKEYITKPNHYRSYSDITSKLKLYTVD